MKEKAGLDGDRDQGGAIERDVDPDELKRRPFQASIDWPSAALKSMASAGSCSESTMMPPNWSGENARVASKIGL